LQARAWLLKTGSVAEGIPMPDKSRIFFYSLLAFCGGIFFGSFFDIPNSVLLTAALVCVALIAIFFRKGSRLVNFKITLTSFLVIFFLLGIARYNVVHSRQQNLPKIAEAAAGLIDPANKHPIRVALYGYVVGEPVMKSDKQEFAFLVKEMEALSRRIKIDERLLVVTRAYPNYEYGQRLKVYGEIKFPQNFEDFAPVKNFVSKGAGSAATTVLGRPASNGIDYKSYLAKDNIFTVSYYPEISLTNLNLSSYEKFKIKFFQAIFRVKNVFKESISRSVAEPKAAFISGILLGSRADIPTNIKESFNRTSTTHILAISGYNITIIATIISWFFLFFFRRPIAFWFSVAGIFVFAILTGAQASVVRAAIMGILVLLAQREGRLNDPRNALVLTGALMVFINPLILRYDIGFQLSFAATIGLIYAAPLIEKYFEKLPNFFNFRETFVMTLSAQLFVLPLLIYYFKNLSLVSLPTNIIILPLIPYTMALGAISGVAGLILPFLGRLVGHFAWLLASFELGVIQLFAKPRWAAVSTHFNWLALIIAYALIIGILLWLDLKNKREESSGIKIQKIK
jgi:competence protein ComEC